MSINALLKRHDLRRLVSGRGLLRGSSAMALYAAMSGGAIAADQSNPAVEEVVVTASRAALAGYEAPTPTTVLSAADLTAKQTVNLADTLNQLPEFKAVNSAANTSVRTQAVGSNQADLRGIGSARTLVLVDGMRVVPMAPSSNTGFGISPDLNQIPQLMVQRVDIVTGGASAQWGSDAVSGVVNIILRNDFTGLEVTGQGSLSDYGDDGATRLGLLYGTGFDGDKGHLVFGFDAAKDPGVGGIETRPWGRQNYQIISNPCGPTVSVSATCPTGPNGQPAQIISPNVLPYFSTGGLITSGPLKNNYFTSSTTVAPFQVGQFQGATSMVGGQGQSIATGISLVAATERADPYLHLQYDLGANYSVFAEASYSYSRGSTHVAPGRDSGLVINIANPFLPASVVASMTAAKVTSFTMNKIIYPNVQGSAENETPHFAVGGKGALFADWSWDAHIGWGRNRFHQQVTNDQNKANDAFAVNAVNNGGQIVCAATVVGSAAFNPAAAGCVPVNYFGTDAASPAALAYIYGTENSRTTYEQTSAAVNLKGSLFSTWAGPILAATGFEYRRERENNMADPVSVAGGWSTGNGSAFTGGFDVKEGYGEIIVPLAKDMAYAKDLSFDGALRYASYSSAGNQTTWKVGLQYTPFDGLLFRGTTSRDIRAPAVFELFGPGSTVSQAVNGTHNGIPYAVGALASNLTIGNSQLQPEVGYTRTYGVVLKPDFAPGLSASVDYYDIKLDGAITAYNSQTVANFCSAAVATYCNYFTFNAAGTPTALNVPVSNLASIHDQGIDFAADYHADLSDFIADAPGSFSLRANATYVMHALVNTGTTLIDRAGQNDASTSSNSQPSVRGIFSATYSIDKLVTTVEFNYISAGHIDNTFNTTPALSININNVPAVVYTNLRASYDVSDHLQFFASIKNLGNIDPPVLPSASTFTATNGGLYDTIGRDYTLGVTYKF